MTEELLQLWPAAGISHPNLPRAISPQPQPGWKRAELHLGTQEGSVGKGGAPCQPQMGRQKEKGLPEPCMETEHKKKKIPNSHEQNSVRDTEQLGDVLGGSVSLVTSWADVTRGLGGVKYPQMWIWGMLWAGSQALGSLCTPAPPETPTSPRNARAAPREVELGCFWEINSGLHCLWCCTNHNCRALGFLGCAGKLNSSVVYPESSHLAF